MERSRGFWIAVIGVFGLSLLLSPGDSGLAHARKGKVVKQGAKTFGRSVKAFFKGGKRAAKSTWKSNAAQTKAAAKK